MEESIKFQIKNFRSLEDVEVTLKPNIFIFGSNGSGKSSLLKAISFFSNYIFNVLNYDILITDPYVHLVKSALYLNEYSIFNSYKDIVINNDISKQIGFIATISNSYINVRKIKDIPKSAFINQTTYPDIKLDYLINLAKDEEELDWGLGFNGSVLDSKNPTENSNYRVSFLFKNSSHDYDLLQTIQFEDIDENLVFSFTPRFTSSEENFYPHLEPYVRFSFEDESTNFIKEFIEHGLSSIPSFDAVKRKNIDQEIVHEINLYFLRKEKQLNDNYFKQLSHVEKQLLYDRILKISDKIIIHIPQKINEVFSRLIYIPSIRELPKHSYPLSGGRFSEKDYLGILKRLDEDVFNSKLKDEINNVLKTYLNIDESIKLVKKELSGCINVKNLKSGALSNISNASSGIQQILPIIFFLLDHYHSPIFLCEQPELHLHPQLQTKLASFIVSNNQKNKVKIIETHSEHIIRKVQVLIAKGELGKDKVAVYYFDKDQKSGVTSIKEMEMEDNGFFKDPWPDGFFDDSYNLTKELLRANKN
jgi:predicted ATPase